MYPYFWLPATLAVTLLFSGCSVKVVPVTTEHKGVFPSHNGIVTVQAGEALYKADDYRTYEGAEMLKRSLHIRQGDVLMAYRYDDQRNTYCQIPYCFLDTNNDGAFDQYTRFDGVEHENDFERTRNPHPYRLVALDRNRFDGSSTVVLFSGMNGDRLVLEYREFKQGLSRPSFSENVEFSAATLPFEVRYRGVAMEVLAVDDSRLQYRMLPR